MYNFHYKLIHSFSKNYIINSQKIPNHIIIRNYLFIYYKYLRKNILLYTIFGHLIQLMYIVNFCIPNSVLLNYSLNIQMDMTSIFHLINKMNNHIKYIVSNHLYIQYIHLIHIKHIILSLFQFQNLIKK